MFLRVDKLQVELPALERQDPGAAALQELLGGKHGERKMSGDFVFQSFDFRSRNKPRPCYSLDAACTAKGDGGGMSDHPTEEMSEIGSKPYRNSH